MDSAGDSYSLAGWPTKRGHGQARAFFADRAGGRGLRRQRIERVLPIGGAAPRRRLSIRFSDHITKTSIWPSGCAGPAIAVFSLRGRVIYHDVSATYDHGSPSLQRRMARNAEIVFWANMPPGLLALAMIPHLAFVALQGVWRLVRGRLRPFLMGKCDALRAWPEIRARRRFRALLARRAVAPPHFALGAGSLRDVANHLTRPNGQSARARLRR